MDLILAGHEAMMKAVEDAALGLPPSRHAPMLSEDYEVVRELGRGGMGVVYLARQKSLGREVAVKVLSPAVASHAGLVERFLAEARHMAQVRHPNVVAVYEAGQAGGEPYFTMEYIPGEPLAARLTVGPLTPSHAAALIRQVAEAVAHAHSRGIVHRDLKPANVLLDADGRALVTDFGLARHQGGLARLTLPGDLLGTPAYMSPEQARGDQEMIGEASDIHALGAILYEMLTGRPPYGHDAPAAVFQRLLNEAPVAPRRLRPRVPADLETICLKALEKPPARRYATAQAMVEDLRRYEAGEPILARRPGWLILAGRYLARQWRIWVAAGVTAVAVGGLAYWLSDPPAATLLAWGREREERGDLAGAAEVYQRVWKQSQGSRRAEAREALTRCIRGMSDGREAAAAARPLLDEVPDESFGPHDFLVAQAVFAELKARNPGKWISDLGPGDRELLELARGRLLLFLRGPHGSAEERAIAQGNLAAAEGVLFKGPLRPAPPIRLDEPLKLPDGTNEELEKLASDPEQHPWRRGEAALAIALRKDLPGRAQRAEEAFELLRSVYPMYEGVAASTVIAPLEGSRIGREAPQCRLLREAHALAQKLSPGQPSRLRGGIHLRLRGVDLPAGVAANIHVTMQTKGAPAAGQKFLPHRNVPFSKDEALVGVADGEYLLKLDTGTWTYQPSLVQHVRLLVMDLERVQGQVVIDGEYVPIDIPVRKLGEIRLLGPAAGAAFAPATDFLRWEEVKGAASYQVSLDLEQDGKGSRTITSLPPLTVKGPRVCLGTLEDAHAGDRLRKLRPGQIATWSVSALDREGRRIAVSLETHRPLLIAGDGGDKASGGP
jgi:predicted Ser/Thr protein kinase